MVYYKTGKGAKRKKIGVTIGAGPVKITSANPSLRRQVMNVKKSVKELQNKDELKYLDTFINATAMSSTSTLTLLNGMTLGDDVSNREGNEISPTSIQCKYNLLQSGLAVGQGLICRHIVFWDSQTNGAAPSAGDLLDLATITLPTIAPYKRQYQKRFKVIHDKTHTFSVGSVDPTSPTTQIVSPSYHGHFKRALSRVVKYRNAQNAGTVVDIASNSLYSLWVTNSSAGNNVVVTAGYRMYFKDD